VIPMRSTFAAYRILGEIVAALEAGDVAHSDAAVDLRAGGSLRSVFAVSDLAQASVAAAGVALARFMAVSEGQEQGAVVVDRDLASAWFQLSIRPDGWELPPPWDPVAGDYRGVDGWVRLHTNAAHHRRAALAVLGAPADRSAVASAVSGWTVDALEDAVVQAGGAAAAMRSLVDWSEHPQGRAVAAEPLLAVERGSPAPSAARTGPVGSDAGPVGSDAGPVGSDAGPLSGIRVLDLTRVLAGPAATRTLAGWGADVLRIDPPEWDEPGVVPEMTLGKRCARLDLRTDRGMERFLELLAGADVLVHGYRSDALERLGLGWEARDQVRGGLIDVSLDAYGWSGPWSARRGFDSLVQMSCGIADAGRRAAGVEKPTPLPVQALDHATGWILAAAVIAGLTLRTTHGVGSRWRGSLARTAQLLIQADPNRVEETGGREIQVPEPLPELEQTGWGPARRLAPPIEVAGAPLRWTRPARALGSDPPAW
jgi:CoA-transferase family III